MVDLFLLHTSARMKTKTRLPLRVNIAVLGAAVTVITNQSASAGQLVHIVDLTCVIFKNISRKLGHVKRCSTNETGSCGKTGHEAYMCPEALSV